LFFFSSFLYLVAFYHIAIISSFAPFFCPFNVSSVCNSHSSYLLSVVSISDVSSALFCTIVASVLHVGPATLYSISSVHSLLTFFHFRIVQHGIDSLYPPQPTDEKPDSSFSMLSLSTF